MRYAYFYGFCYTEMQIKNQEPGTHAEWRKRMMKVKDIAEFQSKPVRVIDTPEKEEFFLSRVIE